MQLTEIIAAIEKIAPLGHAAAWDLSGLQVAARRTEVTALAVCLDPTPASLAAALAQGAEMVLSHHPLHLKPALPNRCDNYREALRLLLCADVPLYAAHTSLDVNPYGPAGWLARDLDLRNLSVLEPAAPAQGAELPPGYGLAGDLPEACSVAALAARLARQGLDLATAVCCGPQPRSVRRVAYCTGSGASLMDAAAQAGAQLYITGDVKYHAALEAAVCLLDVGHHSLEEEMMRRMSLLLQQALAGVTVRFVPSRSPFRPVVFS
ncbi:Nif3-like dinuclear metal center hexameric protein [Desulfovibrio legallii]|uniref:GTP cyclohydrolase 1 type 2 homolog n=1 Tax=Desulfovibrio legallii TaxID=571438 RepID=A0A1G7LCP4_9BACT|nr:Nif3-like dinuclear metal center hexameric protein [Desulfovibrio legallii]SDF47258.1 dinuclear metal center protein, YbgI/SA1388 family [Desulfovibrio legallii]